MSSTIYREDAALIILDIPGDSRHFVSADVLFQTITNALKKQRGHVICGGRTTLRLDGDGRLYVNEVLIYTPRGVVG